MSESGNFGWVESAAFIFAVWQTSPTLFFRKRVNFCYGKPSCQILPAVGCFTGYALKNVYAHRVFRHYCEVRHAVRK